MDSLRAVFLSYASQDAEAAKRLCDALRAADVEVWFDRNELRGGDSWDRKIRERIRTCALFIPIISENTQARPEGYFRLEWHLAHERTHLIGRGKAFLVPVCIDHTRHADADAPDSFLAVQWMRLEKGEATPAFVERIRTLLSGDTTASTPRGSKEGEVQSVVAPTLRPARWVKPILAGVALVVAALVVALWRHSREGGAGTPPAAAAPAPPQIAAAVDDKSIAVLPFVNMSGDKENAYFADGVHEDLLTKLANIGELKVTSRTSAEEYRGTAKNVRQIAAELGVASILEGSVRRDGDRVRVTAQLIDARTDRHRWAKNYDRELKDVFAIQAELAGDIAQSLQATLSVDMRSALARVPTRNMQAYELLLRQQALNSHGSVQRPDIDQSIALLQEAVQLDPDFAIAWARLGTMHARQIFDFIDVSPERQELAQQAIDRALELAPASADVRLEAGNFHYYAHRDYARAEAVYEALLRDAPNNIEALAQLAYALRREGRLRESNTYLEQVLALDPRHQRALGNMFYNDMRRHDYAAAQRTVERLLRLRPDDTAFRAQWQETEWRRTGSFASYDAWRAAQPADLSGKNYFVARLDFSRALARRDFDGARRVLGAAEGKYWLFIEQPLLELAAGDRETARHLAEDCLAKTEGALRGQPENPTTLASRALLRAIMGEPAAARRDWQHAVEILPASRDAFVGADVEATGARIHAILGERELALNTLERALGSTAYIDGQRADTDPAFAALWDDPAFIALVRPADHPER